MIPFWPWEHDEVPYFIDSETNTEWYFDKTLMDHVTKDTTVHRGLKNVFVFIRRRDGEALDRVMINEKGEVLHTTSYDMEGLSAMGVRIDVMKFHQSFTDHAVQL